MLHCARVSAHSKVRTDRLNRGWISSLMPSFHNRRLRLICSQRRTWNGFSRRSNLLFGNICKKLKKRRRELSHVQRVRLPPLFPKHPPPLCARRKKKAKGEGETPTQ